MAKKKQQQQQPAQTETGPEYTNLQIDLKELTDVQITAIEVLLFEGRLREREEILAELKAVLPATMESAYWAGLMQALTIVQNRHSSRASDEGAPASE